MSKNVKVKISQNLKYVWKTNFDKNSIWVHKLKPINKWQEIMF